MKLHAMARPLEAFNAYAGWSHDYDTIATHTSLSFASTWVAPRGSMD